MSSCFNGASRATHSRYFFAMQLGMTGRRLLVRLLDELHAAVVVEPEQHDDHVGQRHDRPCGCERGGPAPRQDRTEGACEHGQEDDKRQVDGHDDTSRK